MPVSGFIVITHNGKMPRDGGLRIAYLACGQIIDIATGRVYPVPVPAPPRKLELIYRNLPVCNTWGSCACQADNPSQFEETDEGMKRIVTCQICGKKMRFRFQ